MKKSSWFIFFLILAASCLDDPDCFRLNNNVVGFAFRVIGSNRADTVRLVRINVSGTESIVPDTVTSSVYVPINFTTNSSKITFWFEDGTSKFVDVDYLLKTQFISEDCGSRYELSNLSVREGSDIDSIRVISREPNKSTGAINIELMRCPDPRYVGVAFFDTAPTTNATTPYTVRAGSLAVDSITNGQGEVFYRQSNRSIFYLPVDLAATQTVFSFYTRGGDAANPPQLRLTYTATPRNAFPDVCQSTQFAENLRIDADSILSPLDSLGINENNEFIDYTTDPPSSNVRLFRCPQTNLARLTFRQKTSANGTNTREDTMAVKRITSDYAPGRVYAANQDFKSVILPVNPDSDSTTFYIEYTNADIPNDTVRVGYTRTTVPSGIRNCGGVTTYTNLAGAPSNATNIIVAPSGNTDTSTLRNPPTSTNIQVIHEVDQ
jgi:hypothetical protein